MQAHSKIFNHTKAYTPKRKSPLDLTHTVLRFPTPGATPHQLLGYLFFFFGFDFFLFNLKSIIWKRSLMRKLRQK